VPIKKRAARVSVTALKKPGLSRGMAEPSQWGHTR
jgi:hypothetical protein